MDDERVDGQTVDGVEHGVIIAGPDLHRNLTGQAARPAPRRPHLPYPAQFLFSRSYTAEPVRTAGAGFVGRRRFRPGTTKLRRPAWICRPPDETGRGEGRRRPRASGPAGVAARTTRRAPGRPTRISPPRGAPPAARCRGSRPVPPLPEAPTSKRWARIRSSTPGPSSTTATTTAWGRSVALSTTRDRAWSQRCRAPGPGGAAPACGAGDPGGSRCPPRRPGRARRAPTGGSASTRSETRQVADVRGRRVPGDLTSVVITSAMGPRGPGDLDEVGAGLVVVDPGRISARSASPGSRVSGVRARAPAPRSKPRPTGIAIATRSSSRWSRSRRDARARRRRAEVEPPSQVVLAPVLGPLGHLGHRCQRLAGSPGARPGRPAGPPAGPCRRRRGAVVSGPGVGLVSWLTTTTPCWPDVVVNGRTSRQLTGRRDRGRVRHACQVVGPSRARFDRPGDQHPVGVVHADPGLQGVRRTTSELDRSGELASTTLTTDSRGRPGSGRRRGGPCSRAAARRVPRPRPSRWPLGPPSRKHDPTAEGPRAQRRQLLT